MIDYSQIHQREYYDSGYVIYTYIDMIDYCQIIKENITDGGYVIYTCIDMIDYCQIPQREYYRWWLCYIYTYRYDRLLPDSSKRILQMVVMLYIHV